MSEDDEKVRLLQKLLIVWRQYPNLPFCEFVSKLSGLKGTPYIRCRYGEGGVSEIDMAHTPVDISAVTDKHIEAVLDGLRGKL
jgi:hypothetical protein